MTNKSFPLISIIVAVFNDARTLQQCSGVLLELSLVPLYAGQILWQELIANLVKTNHHIYALQTGFINNETGQTLQLDGLFFSKLGA